MLLPDAGHQGGIDRHLAEDGHHAIHGVAFADAAGVELHARPVEPHRARRGVEMNVPIAGLLQRGHDFGAMRQMSRALIKPPNFHQRTHRNIKRPFTFAAVILASRQQLEQLLGNPDRAFGGVPVHAAPLARGLVIRQQVVQAPCLVKRRVGGGFHGHAAGTVEHHRIGRPHGVGALFQPERGLRPGRRERRQQKQN